MGSFDTKPARAESVNTPMDLSTSAMPMCPQPNERMEKRICKDLIATQGSRRVEHNNNHIEATNIMKDGPRDIYMRYRQLIQNAGAHLLIVVDEVVKKTITDVRFFYEEPAVLFENTPQTTRSTVMPKGQQQEGVMAELWCIDI